MRSLRLWAAFLGYCFLLWILFLGIQRGEVVVRELWYRLVTKQMVAQQSHIPVEKCILGVYKPELPYSFRLMHELEDTLGQRFTIVSFYQAWGDNPEHAFQPLPMSRIVENGAVPMVTWEPWVSGFEGEELEPMPEREWKCLRDIANGHYDDYITQWARAAVAWGKPFFLRFAHEMTNPQYPWSPVNGNTPVHFKHAWWHVQKIFAEQGAENVIWVWCPYGTNVMDYYPGDEHVDWVAMDVFNYGEILFGEDERRWMSFDELASPLYAELTTVRKPLMIAEVGCSDIGGSREVWYREMLAQIEKKFTRVKALVLFENPSDRTSGIWDIDWGIGNAPDVATAVREAFIEGHFLYIQEYSVKLAQ